MNPPVSELFLDTEQVFLSRPGRIPGSKSPVFADEVWDAAGVLPQRANQQPAQARIVFPRHPAWSLRSREIAMALLNPTDPRLLERSVSFGCRTFSLGHVRCRAEMYKVAALWQEAKQLPDDITQWRGRDWVAMVDKQITKGQRRGSVRNLVTAIRDLVALSPILTGGGIASDPWNGKPTSVITKRAITGTTEVIAPDRWIPLIDACWKYVSVFAEDILSLRQTHDCALRLEMAEGDRRSSRHKYTRLLEDYLESTDAVVPVSVSGEGAMEPQWGRLSTLVSVDLSHRVFYAKRILGQRRRQIVQDAIAAGDVECRIVDTADFKALLDKRIAEFSVTRSGLAPVRAEQADRVLQRWIDRSPDRVALRRTSRRRGREITEQDVNWAMMERIVYGPDASSTLLRGNWVAARRRKRLILAEAQSGRTFVADKGVMSAQRECVDFVNIEQASGERLPWRETMSDFEARCELRALRAACYVFMAAMTMMRDSELQDIQRNSTSSHYGVRAVKSNVYKGRRPESTAHWWIVDEVATAIAVLERLSVHPTHLFARFVDGYHEVIEPGVKAGREIDFLLEHLSATGARSGLASIPDGAPISPRALRRTTTCISRELGGNELAVSQQLKHVISYGYSNVTAAYMAPDPAWANLLNTNHSEENLEHMVAVIQDAARGAQPLAGQGGERLTAELVRASEAQGGTRTQSVLLSDSQVAALLKRIAPAIHFGPANACLYDEETALCRRGATTEIEGPLLGLCQPSRCPNSVIGTEHLPVWISEGQMLKTLLHGKHVSSPRRQALTNRLSDVERVLDQADVSRGDEQQ